MNPKQIVILIGAAFFIVGSVLPKPIIERATSKPIENQIAIRLSLASLGLVMILALRTVT